MAVPDDAALLAERLAAAEASIAELTDLVMDLTDDNERLGQAHHRLLRRARRAETAHTPGSALARSDGPDPVALVSTIASPSAVPALVRDRLPHVALPERACVELDRLDAAISSEVWARKALEAFMAMDAYAQRSNDYPGDFRHWAMHSGHDHAFGLGPRIAMQESTGTRNSARTQRARVLPIDRRVTGSSRTLMVAHIRLVCGGGMAIPRIFFLDDTRGPTARMHVGFYGPHDRVPNVLAN